MRNLFFIALVLIAISACNESPKSTAINKIETNKPIISTKPWSHLNLYHTQGKVKKMIQTTYLAKRIKGKLEKVTIGTRYETSWDEQGMLKEQSYFNSSLKRQTKTNYLLDGTQKWLSAKTTTNDGKLIKSYTFKYLPNGVLMEENQANTQNQVVVSVKNSWSPNQQLIERSTWDHKGNLAAKCSYTLNEKGFPIQTVYDYVKNKTKIICKTQHEQLDPNGNWIKAVETTSKGSIFIHERVITYYP